MSLKGSPVSYNFQSRSSQCSDPVMIVFCWQRIQQNWINATSAINR